MTLILTAGPAEEPVTLAEARAFLRLDDTSEDMLVTALITAARATLEAETRRAFVTQNWRLLFDQFPEEAIVLPLAPVSAVAAISLVARTAPDETLDAALYELDLGGEPPCIWRAPGAAWPMTKRRVAGVAVDFTAGYGGAESVPQPLKQAVLMLVAHWYETRLPVAFDGAVSDIPLTVAALIAPYRRFRL
ncbi:head-tail connector protein [Parvibaculum sp.]|uniref:head-tail connector protein n=1 Tax=Parvibaculum sp. TaxID=2024848 RepID=UPI00320ECFDA